MSRDTILKAPDGTRYSLDTLATQKWLDGHAPGAERVAGWLRGQALEAFKVGKDDHALLLRGLAERVEKEIVNKLKTAAADHALKYPYEIARKVKASIHE
jgi:hypothetical protein